MHFLCNLCQKKLISTAVSRFFWVDLPVWLLGSLGGDFKEVTCHVTSAKSEFFYYADVFQIAKLKYSSINFVAEMVSDMWRLFFHMFIFMFRMI